MSGQDGAGEVEGLKQNGQFLNKIVLVELKG